MTRTQWKKLKVLWIEKIFLQKRFTCTKENAESSDIEWLCRNFKLTSFLQCSRKSPHGVQPPSRASLICHVCLEPRPEFKVSSFHRGIDGGPVKLNGWGWKRSRVGRDGKEVKRFLFCYLDLRWEVWSHGHPREMKGTRVILQVRVHAPGWVQSPLSLGIRV